MKTLFKNEFIMAPLKLGYCHDKDGKVNERHLNFYQQRAEYLGAIISEPFYLHPGLRENPFQLGIDNDDKIEGIAKISELAHSYGTKFIVHLNHPGRMANPNIPNNFYWSASAVPCENGGVTPIAMDENMMNTAIDTFVQAATRAQKANADFIELQFGYGYLLSQFLSPQINLRTDEYGGSFENRLKFPLRVLKAIQQSVSIPIIARVSATDFQPNGISIEESIMLSQRLEKEGIVAIHVTAGSACSAPAWFYQHMFTQKGKTWEMANQIQNNIHIPVIFHGRIHSIDDIKLLKEKYNARYFSIGRALVADEHFVAKVLGITEETIRPCLACSEGCLGGVRAGKGLGCVVNPKVNNSFPKIQKASKPKKIAVVGGGLAGMEVAIQLANNGHEITIYEKDKLGGQFLLAYLPPKKESLLDIVDFYKKEIERLKIPVVYKEATSQLIEQQGYDEVVIATGAKPVIPNIKGLTKYHWAEILEKPDSIQNKKVVIIGGGLIGVEIASKLIDYHNQIIIVEMLDEIARGLEMIERNLTLAKFKQHNVQILLKHKVVEVNGTTVILENENHERVQLQNIDEIVVSVGMQSYKPFETSIPMHFVGDALKVAKAQEAIYEAYKLATQIYKSMENLSALVFGPVPSRRLGKSMGINNIPFKICTYSCAYCQLGKAVKMQVDRQEFFNPDVIVEAVREKLKSLSTQEFPDYLTIVPDGEPTLDIHLGELIKKLKKFDIPVAVITNSSLLSQKNVQQELSMADYVSVKIDAVSPEIWRKVDKPHKAIDFKANLEAIPQFRKQFKGKFVTETMLIQGLNDTADEIEKIAQYIAKLSPEVSYIAIPTRPTAFVDIVPASEQMVAFAYQQFTNHKIQTELLIGYEGNAFATSGNFAEDLLSITAVHPMREEAVVELMKNSNAKPETLLSLIEQQLIEKVVYNQNTYYLRKFPKQKITCKK